MRLLRALILTACVATQAQANTWRYPDFDGDGKTDLVWSNANPCCDETITLWRMDGTQPIEAARFRYGFRWLPFGPYADFNGDGKTDLWWFFNVYPGVTPSYAIQLMDGLATTSSGQTGPFAAAPDLDGDGKSDLVALPSYPNLQSFRLQLMDGLTVSQFRDYSVPEPWRWPSGPGDFDGDGKDDLLFAAPDGSVAIWLMDGVDVKSAEVVLGPSAWRVWRVADFDGDGKADLLWRNESTGAMAMWLMDGVATREAALVFGDANWSVTHVGDFDGDGRADLLWLNSLTGVVAMWLMDGVAAVSADIISTDPSWSVVKLGDFNGDGRSDLVWKNATEHLFAIWLMDGAECIDADIILHDALWYPI